MVKEGTWQNKNVDLKQLTEKIKKFFYADKFSEVQNFEDPNGAYIKIQARKTGVFRTLTSQRKAIQVIIRGDPNNFHISVSSGEWGKNITAGVLLNLEVSLVGLGLNALFSKKVWNFINDAVASLENSYKQSITSVESKKETPLQILQKRLALGEITKEEFVELSSIIKNNKVASKDEVKNETESVTPHFGIVQYNPKKVILFGII